MPGTIVRQNVVAKARRVVIKIGTNSICDESGRLNNAAVGRLAEQISAVMAAGRHVTLVASGAIGSGMAELDLPARPRALPMLQATAAVGQGQLMRVFYDTFARYGVKVAQVLVTRDAFEDRGRYLNIRNTLGALHELGVLPIINENDAVAVDEIKFGDNDIISALVANMLRADLLVLLTTVDGVLKDGAPLDVIETVNDDALGLVMDSRSKLGSGGMASKLKAAGMVTGAGEAVVIANGATPGVIGRLLAGERLGTVFVPARRRMSSRRRWIGHASRAAGRIMVDDGAAKALREGGKSLLPSGIRAISGKFARGATVAIVDAAGRTIARGLTNYSSEQIDLIKGLKTAQAEKALGEKGDAEVVHRNNMTIT
jgi:glutamate 5-kinase